jgi:heme-degrading monooxygenase HmoA
MILEVATLDVKAGQEAAFEEDFGHASRIIAAIPGYVSHQLLRCLEKSNRYLLLVRWETLESHTIGFRKSPHYQAWKEALHHYYDPFPTVEHFALPPSAGELAVPRIELE